MLAFAFSECGLTVDEFFSLSWYEWSLHIYRAKSKRKDEHRRWENQAILVREQMALIANTNRDPMKKPTPYKGSDFFKLSFDEVEDEEVEKRILSPEEVEKKFGKLLIPVKNGE